MTHPSRGKHKHLSPEFFFQGSWMKPRPIESSYRLFKIRDGITNFARVSVRASRDVDAGIVIDDQVPEFWRAAAEQGVQNALNRLQTNRPALVVWKVEGTTVDTRANAVEVATEMAALRLVCPETTFEVTFHGTQMLVTKS